jgi:hypothetical protein
MSEPERVKITVSFEADVNMGYYPANVLSTAEAVAFDFTEQGGIEALLGYLDSMDNLVVVSVTEVIDEKNDTAILAERLSKELSSE